MRVLIGCEFSGSVSGAVRAQGHEVYSCDIEPTAQGTPRRWHIQKDIFELLNSGYYWDLVILHPPCTFLSVSGLHWNKRIPERVEKTEEALHFVQRMFDWADKHPQTKVAIENPISCISSRIRTPDQIVQPWMFGDDASKATCFWLFNGLKPLVILPDSGWAKPRIVVGKNGKKYKRWANQTDSGQNKLPPSKNRAAVRSTFFPGMSKAIAEQWTV